MKFEIDECSLTSVTVRKSWGRYDGQKEITPDQLVEIIKGNDRISSISSEDHPEFATLREMLGLKGYIRIERGMWNGDTVIKGFHLNGKRFRKGDQFFCAAAMLYHLQHK